MLSAASRPYIDASVPVLKQHGLAITQRFYSHMLGAHPELRNLFNLGNQANGAQAQSLAAAVFAYAANIDNGAALAPVVERIVHKHAAVGIKPSHYPIVGRYLLAAIQEVLGDAATPALIAAWDEAYWLLAGELIAAEARLYQATGTEAGKLQTLRVTRVEDDGEDVKSFYLEREAGGSPGDFLPGQYISAEARWPETQSRQLRQYSLSDSPEKPYWRITVKRAHDAGSAAHGAVSNWLHAQIKPGDTLHVSPAFGDFTPALAESGPIVLISAGVGITPMVSALNALAAARSARSIHFLHGARGPLQQTLRADLVAAAAALPNLHVALYYEAGAETAAVGLSTYSGHVDIDPTLAAINQADADFYLCGPLPFMRAQRHALLSAGVPATRVQREVFGPELLDHLL
jgi:nitric oxide dioxygenase